MRRPIHGTATAAVLAAALATIPGAFARAEETAALTLKDHHFAPAELTVPANTRVRVTVTNLDPTPAEFESDDFKAEKVVPAGQAVTIILPALKPGTYEFHDEYHEDASKAQLLVK